MTRLLLLCTLCLGVLLSSCVDDESVFTDGRLEDLCNGAIPVCDLQASCMLTNEEYYRGSFPGGFYVFVRSNAESNRIMVRFLLTEMLYPGTELHVIVRTPDCGHIEEEHILDRDIFDFAGDDRIIDFDIPLPGKGDHLVEVVSDMNADFLMTTTVSSSD